MARGAAAPLRAEQVIEAGLGLYSQGDLVGALKRWRQALEIDPDNRRAREYVTYVEEHYELLARKLRGEGPAQEDEEGPGATIEMEADDPMEEIDAYDSVEVSISSSELPRAELADAGSSPTEEMKPQKLVVKPDTFDEEDDGEITGEEATKAEGLRRRLIAPTAGPAVGVAMRPVVITEESVDEGWSLEGLEDALDALGPRDDVDTLELAAQPGYTEDLSDLGTREETHDPYADERDDDEPPIALKRPSDDATGEVTRPEGRARRDSGRQRSTERSTPPPMPAKPAPAPARGRGSTAPPPLAAVKSPLGPEPRAEFDLADFDDPDAVSLGAPNGAVTSARPAVAAAEDAEVRVTFRSPREDEQARTGSPSGPRPVATPPPPPEARWIRGRAPAPRRPASAAGWSARCCAAGPRRGAAAARAG